MKKFIDSLLQAARKYTVLDYTFFKICLVSLGIILGVYFSKFFAMYLLFIWTILIISYLWIIYKTFISYRK